MADTGKTEAKIVDGALVLSIRDGETPRLWRTDMQRVSSFDLATRGAATALVMKTKDTTEDVHVFTEKQDALQALEAVSGALFRGAGPSAGASPRENAARGGGSVFGALVKGFLIILACFALFVFIMVKVRTPSYENMPPPGQTGVPVPADKLLGGE